MQPTDDQTRFEAAVREKVENIIAAQQAQWAEAYETMMRKGMEQIDSTQAALEKERLLVINELDAAKEALWKVEREGDRLAQAYFEGRQQQFREAARTEYLRQLTRKHLEAGRSTADIAAWLNVSPDFIQQILLVMQRNVNYKLRQPDPSHRDGSPRLRYSSEGRGGTIWFESDETQFDMWWEFAGGDAIVIVDIPTKEQWVARTRLPLERREGTLRFIGEQIVNDRLSGSGSFVIGENVMTFYA